ncbi:glycosyltransferase family 39 protein [bacterium]|nr:glycosyltransferase family 39 protein [bacterium]
MENGLTHWESKTAEFLSRWYVFIPLTVLVSLLIYGVSLDDFPIPETFAHMLPFSLAALIDQTWNGLWNFCRPTAMVIFRIGYALFESNYVGYRFMLIFIHLINVFLVFSLAKVLFRNRFVSVASALIFATHPIHSECICLIVSLFDVSCLTFYLASLLAFSRYLDARQRGTPAQIRKWLIFTGVFVVLCLGSKEVGVTLPFVMIAFDACTRVRSTRLKDSVIAIAKNASPFLLILAVYIVFRIARYEQNVSYMRLFLDDPLGLFAKMGQYLRLAFFPNQIWVLLLAMIPFARRQYIFALVFLLLPFLPPLQIEPQERFVYVPSAGYTMAVAWCLVIGVRKLAGKFTRFHWTKRLASIGSAAAILLFIGQIPFAYMNTRTWSESIPIRKALSSIWGVVGTPKPGTVLYFANIDPQFNLSRISEYDSTSAGKFRCEKLINYLYEDHAAPEFFFKMVGFGAQQDNELSLQCKQLAARFGKLSYGQKSLFWGPGGFPLSQWKCSGAELSMIDSSDEANKGLNTAINMRITESEAAVLTSPLLNTSTLGIANVVISIDRTQLSRSIDCQLVWILLPEDETRDNPRSEIRPREVRKEPAMQLTSSRWLEGDPSTHVDAGSFDLVNIDLGSRPEWVFEKRMVKHIALRFYGSGNIVISSIKLESPSRTRLAGLMSMVQFHE